MRYLASLLSEYILKLRFCWLFVLVLYTGSNAFFEHSLLFSRTDKNYSLGWQTDLSFAFLNSYSLEYIFRSSFARFPVGGDRDYADGDIFSSLFLWRKFENFRGALLLEHSSHSYFDNRLNEYFGGFHFKKGVVEFGTKIHRVELNKRFFDGLLFSLVLKGVSFRKSKVFFEAQYEILNKLGTNGILAGFNRDIELLNGRLTFNPKVAFRLSERSYFFFREGADEIDVFSRDSVEFGAELNLSPFDWLTCSYSFGAGRINDSYSLREPFDSLRSSYLKGISKKNDFKASNFSLSAARRNIYGKLYYLYDGSNYRYGSSIRNEERKKGEFGGESFVFWGVDSVKVNFLWASTSFDDELEPERSKTRDLGTKKIKLSGRFLLYRVLSLSVDYVFNSVHTVYISPYLSASNRYDKTYYLICGYELDLMGFRFFQSVPIVANYMIYDIDRGSYSSDNRLRRELKVKSGVKKQVSWFKFDLAYTYKFEDYGELLWRDEWIERLFWEKPGQIFSSGFAFVGQDLTIGFSFEFEKYRELGYISPTEKKENYSRFFAGFLAYLNYNFSSTGFFELSAGKNRDEFSHRSSYEYPSLNVKLGCKY